jgi:hypothetical protein
MARGWLRGSAALMLVLAASCAGSPTPRQQIQSTEQAALAPLKAKYPDIITAFDISGKKLNIAIDANGYIQTGDDEVDQFKKDAASAWRAAWVKAHPHEHAALTVVFTDYINRVWATLHAQA